MFESHHIMDVDPCPEMPSKVTPKLGQNDAAGRQSSTWYKPLDRGPTPNVQTAGLSPSRLVDPSRSGPTSRSPGASMVGVPSWSLGGSPPSWAPGGSHPLPRQRKPAVSTSPKKTGSPNHRLQSTPVPQTPLDLSLASLIKSSNAHKGRTTSGGASSLPAAPILSQGSHWKDLGALVNRVCQAFQAKGHNVRLWKSSSGSTDRKLYVCSTVAKGALGDPGVCPAHVILQKTSGAEGDWVAELVRLAHNHPPLSLPIEGGIPRDQGMQQSSEVANVGGGKSLGSVNIPTLNIVSSSTEPPTSFKASSKLPHLTSLNLPQHNEARPSTSFPLILEPDFGLPPLAKRPPGVTDTSHHLKTELSRESFFGRRSDEDLFQMLAHLNPSFAESVREVGITNRECLIGFVIRFMMEENKRQ